MSTKPSDKCDKVLFYHCGSLVILSDVRCQNILSRITALVLEKTAVNAAPFQKTFLVHALFQANNPSDVYFLFCLSCFTSNYTCLLTLENF